MHTSTIRTSGNGSHDSRLAGLLDLASGAQDSFAGSGVSCSGIWKRGSGGSGKRMADAHSLQPPELVRSEATVWNHLRR